MTGNVFVKADFRNRGNALLERFLSPPTKSSSFFGNMSIVRLAPHQDFEKANEELRHGTSCFERPIRNGRQCFLRLLPPSCQPQIAKRNQK